MARALRPQWRAIVGAGVAAGVFSTIVQVVLWALFTNELPAILYRDARLAGALVMGDAALHPPATFDLGIAAIATVVHFALSIVYAAVIAPIVARLPMLAALAAGALFGVALYVVNLHAFTLVFPWFTVARGGITLAAHVAFGASAAAAYRWLAR